MAARRDVGVLFQNPENQLVAECVEDDVAFGLENLAWAPAAIARQRRRDARALLARRSCGRASPTCSPAARSSARRWPACSPCRGASWCSTSRPPCWTRPGATRCWRPSHGLRAGGLAVVYVTQEMDEVVGADRVVALEAGTVVYAGSVGGLFGDGALVRRLGLGLPAAGELALELAAAGRQLAPLPLTLDELLVALGVDVVSRSLVRGMALACTATSSLQLRGGSRADPGAARRELRAGRRPVAGAARSVRLGQVDAAAGGQGPGCAGGRRGAAGRTPARRRRTTRPAAAGRPGVPDARAAAVRRVGAGGRGLRPAPTGVAGGRGRGGRRRGARARRAAAGAVRRPAPLRAVRRRAAAPGARRRARHAAAPAAAGRAVRQPRSGDAPRAGDDPLAAAGGRASPWCSPPTTSTSPGRSATSCCVLDAGRVVAAGALGPRRGRPGPARRQPAARAVPGGALAAPRARSWRRRRGPSPRPRRRSA